MTDAANAPTYGNWRRPRKAGLGSLGLVGTLGLFGALVLVLLTSLFSLNAAFVVGLPLALTLAPLAVRTQDGRNVYTMAGVRFGWWRRKSNRQTLYVSGPLSARPGGRFRPPGLLAKVSMLEGRDPYDRPFGVLYHRNRHLYTLVISCEPDGGSLVDNDQVDTWVALWGNWLSRLSHEPGLRGASVIVETAPDPGTRLEQEVIDHIAPTSPNAARAVMEDVVDDYPEASSEMNTYITLTYAVPGGSRSNKHEILSDLALRLQGLLNGLVAAGGGWAEPMSAERIAEAVRVAYDPAVSPDMVAIRAQHGSTGQEWADCGPSATVETVSHYQHDSGVSRSWLLTLAPRGTVRSSVLRSLLDPAMSIRRKRVALIYRPLDPATSARIVEADRRNAHFVANSTKGLVKARASAEIEAAEQAAAEEASGAGLVEFSMVVTLTVDSVEDLSDANVTMRNLLGATRIAMRPADRMQAAAFSCSLPTGILPWEQSMMPQELQEAL
ncbi:SCO6880 family protein [Actinoplanes sp. NPDC051851]|uniref:SCO6880 family protein n=1 Tax=Actinoplanes sp. NPDC051851 TaxID=3154753 RepID=UPI0034338A10